MWREITNLAKRYYEGDKKYITRVFRNTKIQWEMNITGVFSKNESSFMVVLYPLKKDEEEFNLFGPVSIKLFLNDEEALKSALNFIKENINEDEEEINKIYKSPFSMYLVE
jgi:hypothetical protein